MNCILLSGVEVRYPDCLTLTEVKQLLNKSKAFYPNDKLKTVKVRVIDGAYRLVNTYEATVRRVLPLVEL